MITFTALAAAGTPVGPGDGTLFGPAPGLGGAGVAGTGGLAGAARWLTCGEVWLINRAAPPHPAVSDAINKTASSEARCVRATTPSSYAAVRARYSSCGSASSESPSPSPAYGVWTNP